MKMRGTCKKEEACHQREMYFYWGHAKGMHNSKTRGILWAGVSASQ